MMFRDRVLTDPIQRGHERGIMPSPGKNNQKKSGLESMLAIF
jgi:hypothetical protein